ncbi:hypothetical protein T439DRAFT_346059 [Meredithblackwellia eburnea MCA 4105]
MSDLATNGDHDSSSAGSRASTPADPAKEQQKQEPFRLLDLPTEILSVVLHYVALLKFQLAESRRPKPSPLILLGSSCRRLHHVAAPFIWRNFSLPQFEDEKPSLDDAEALLKHPQLRHLRSVRIPFGAGQLPSDRSNMAIFSHVDQIDIWETLGRAEPWLHPPPPHAPGSELIWWALSTFPSARRFSYRARISGVLPLGQRGIPQPLPNLVSISLRACHVTWLRAFASIPTVTSFDLSVWISSPVSEWADDDFWRRIRHFSLEVPPKYPSLGRDCLQIALEGLTIPTDSTLSSLSIKVRLLLERQAKQQGFQEFHDQLLVFRNLPQMRALLLDEYTSLTPSDVESLAKDFPLLQTLKFKDRTVWQGGKSCHFKAISQFTQLTKLECPRWTEDSLDSEDFTEPEDLVLQLAEVLPKLELLGLGGKYSVEQCYRVGRDSEGIPRQVDAVELYDLDLDRRD